MKGPLKNNRLQLSQIQIGASLPDWKLEPIFEYMVPNKNDLLDRPLLILFFSLGCPGCLGRAIPYANRIVFENEGKIQVMGIHTDFECANFSLNKFMEAKQELHIRFPFFKDYNYDTTFLNYGAGGTPHWILVDKNGKVVYSIFGSDPNNALLRLDYMINELKAETQ